MTVKELLPHYKKINRLLHEEDYNTINAILDKATPEGILSIGLLRLTFMRRGKISSWSTFRDKVEKELISKGLNSKGILKGLFVV